MSHLDEGTLHALLDGELSSSEARDAQAHLGTCVACGARLQEVKQFLAEADRLVGALEVPAGAAASAPPARPRQSPPFNRTFREPENWDEPPVLLLPDNAEALARRRRWLSTIRWAAIITLVVGGGRFLVNAVSPGSSLPAARDITTATRPVPPAVASPEETRRPTEPVVATGSARPARPAAQNRAPLAKTNAEPLAAKTEAQVDTTSERPDSAADEFTDSISADSQSLAAGAAAESVPAASSTRSTELSSRTTEAKDSPRREDEIATRQAAAEALAELDRQRRRERAAAATAALERPAPVRVESAPAAEPPAPAPRTPEQRAQVYMRIGLDEAVKQLGRPVHVIEGMTPEFIGLTNGRLVAGADPNRPVVRVVYLDSRGRMILLDQQRLRTGQAPGASEGNLRWSVGDVMLYLRGEPGPDVLRNLQRRVR
jgi:anti-sigma factor RsiW